MRHAVRISSGLLCGIALLATGMRPAFADWSQALDTSRGLRTVTLVSDGAGGALVHWVSLLGQIYESDGFVGKSDGTGAAPAAWTSFTFQPHSWSQELDIAPDGAGGGIVATAEGGDVWAYHFVANGALDPAWPDEPAAVCSATDYQYSPRALSDGAGGAFICWQDPRDGMATVYLTRITANGTIAPGWPVDGKRLGVSPPGGNGLAELRSDFAGGVIVALVGANVQLFHLTADGTTAPGWTDAGLLVTTTATAPDVPRVTVASDGGTVVAWTERGGTGFPLRTAPVRALRVSPGGVLDPRWPAGGFTFATSPDSVSNPAVVADDAGGAFVVWGALAPGGARTLRGVRLAGDGSLASGWPVSGLELVGSAASLAMDNRVYEWEDPAVFTIAPDGLGGLFVGWDDRSLSTTPQVRVTRFRSNGSHHPGWLDAGHPIPASTGTGCVRAVMGAGAGEVLVVWRSILDMPFGSAMLSRVSADVTADVPPLAPPATLALVLASANPVNGALAFDCGFSRDGAGRLDLYDVSGRRLSSRTFDAPAGFQRITAAGSGELPVGVVFARLTQGREQRSLRVVVAP